MDHRRDPLAWKGIMMVESKEILDGAMVAMGGVGGEVGWQELHLKLDQSHKELLQFIEW